MIASLGQQTWLPSDEPEGEDGDFVMLSRTRPGKGYVMVLAPEGLAVHQGEGCEHEIFSGILGCWHSKEGSERNVTQAVTTYQQQVPQRAEFSKDEVQVIKNTICRGSTDAELGLFLATCRSTGLNPFMKQIWAIKRKVNVGNSQNPKYEEQMQIQVGIDGYRVVRDRLVDASGLPLFEGMDGPQWSRDGVEWLDYPYDGAPKFARVAIYRRGVQRPFVAVARWDAYNQSNAMWKSMGAEQLAKCAEALGLRRAFPADMSTLPTGPIAELDPPTEDLPEPLAALLPDAIEGEVVQGPEPPLSKAPSDLIHAIEKRHGLPAKQAAIAAMARLVGTTNVLGLSMEDRALLSGMLQVRLEGTEHEHDEAYGPGGHYLCRLCGDELAQDAEQGALV